MLNRPIFDEPSHTYKNSKEGWFYTSGTTLIGKYKPKFDSDYWSLYNAGRRLVGISDENKTEYSKLLIKYGLDFGKKTVPNLKLALKFVLTDTQYDELINKQLEELDNWKVITKTATDTGTKIHKEKEDGIKESGSDISRYGFTVTIGNSNHLLLNDLYKLEDGVYTELMVWHNGYKIAGTADKVFIETIGNVRFIDIDDYKTNKKIDTQSYQNKATGEFSKMLAPVNDLQDCNRIHYSLQISLYAYLLECFGYVVRNLKFTHLILDENKEIVKENPYFVNYLRDSVIAILKHHNK